MAFLQMKDIMEIQPSLTPSPKGGHTMKFYNQQHKYYCGVDLHARKMYVCILAKNGKVIIHQNIKTDPERFFEIVFPFIKDVVVGVECVFCWHWHIKRLSTPCGGQPESQFGADYLRKNHLSQKFAELRYIEIIFVIRNWPNQVIRSGSAGESHPHAPQIRA